jgi:hypothetical protein
MKRLGLIMAMGAMLSLAPLAACSTDSFQGAVATTVTAVSHNSPVQSNSVAAAGDAYALVANAVTVYVQTAHPAQAVKDRIGQLNDAAYQVLKDARVADKRGDSPAVALAMKAWADKFGALKAFSASLGIALPAGT